MAKDLFLRDRFLSRGNDGGTYYVVQRDDTSTLWWFAESLDARWAHVFRGRITVDDDTLASRWDGRFIDVPKGLACGYGRLGWERRLAGPEAPFLARTLREGDRNRFGGTLVVPSLDAVVGSVQRLEPGFVGSGMQNLTGVWIGTDGGTYYIREVAETGEIAWVGEHPEAEPGTGEMPGRRWVNVFMGQRDNQLIRGEWSDVPKGEVDQHGELTLFVNDERRLTIIRNLGGFGGLRFRRVDELEVTLRWVSLMVHDQQEWFFEGDEPFFFAMIAVMDGRTVNLVDPASSRANFDHSFVAPVLRTNVSAGTLIDLRSLPPLELGIRPVQGDRPELSHPVLGIALRGAEKDNSSLAWQRDRLQNWNRRRRRRSKSRTPAHRRRRLPDERGALARGIHLGQRRRHLRSRQRGIHLCAAPGDGGADDDALVRPPWQ